jgi:hypothetical protein
MDKIDHAYGCQSSWIEERRMAVHCRLIPNPIRATNLAVFPRFFKEVDIDKDGTSHQQSLLLGSGIIWESNIERICIRENLHGQRLWFLEDLSNVWRIAISLLLTRRKHVKWELAATPSTARISLRAAVHAATSTAGRGVNFVDRISIG